jgi:cytochrome bd-I ubiquinol oxidase subunit X
MWYFSWLLGLGLALTFGVLNAIWYELLDRPGGQQEKSPGGPQEKSPDDHGGRG